MKLGIITCNLVRGLLFNNAVNIFSLFVESLEQVFSDYHLSTVMHIFIGKCSSL